MDYTKIPEHQVTTIGDEERAMRRKMWFVRGAVGLAAVVAAGGYFLYWRAEQDAARATVAAARTTLAGQISEDERTYRRLVAGGQVSAEALAALDRAIAKERERQSLGGSTQQGDQRYLEGLERERDDWLAQEALPRLASLEAGAQALREAGDFEPALENLRKALALQRAINGGSAAAKIKDYVRETRLAQALAATEADPLKQEVQSALTAATAAVEAQRWVEARTAYLRARTAQMTLNQKYPGSRFSDTQQLNRIEQELASLQAADAAAAVQAELRRAEEAASAGRKEEGVTALLNARNLQEKLNTEFGRSRFASSARVEEIELRRETILAADDLAALEKEVEATAADLRRRDIVSAGKTAAAAMERLERIVKEWPRRAAAVEAFKARLAFLSVRRAELGGIQEEALNRLLELPGRKETRMLATEVSQELYTRVMNTNPSRNVGRSLPADSMSWREAREFCERLGWVLGRTVRLPTELEWRAAMGATPIAGVWSLENSGGNSREVGKSRANAAGFFDLTGNLAEWLEPAEPRAATAPIAGGSFLDRDTVIKTAPTEPLNKGERARQVGFRFVVETQ